MSSTSKEVRFATIGCGSTTSQVHVPNLVQMPGVRVVAFCDLDESKAKKLADTFGAEYVTTDMNRVFADRGIDAVTIAIGPRAHPAVVQAAAKAGKHVFVEKPLAAELADALATVRAVEQAGIRFVHGTCNRLAPMVKIAKRMCPAPLYSYCQACSTVTHMPVHNIDLAINLFHDRPVVRAYASGGQMWKIEADKDLPADSYSAILTFADGSVHTYFQHGNVVNTMLTKYHYQLFGKDCVVYLAKRYKECHFIKDGRVERSFIFEGADFDRGKFGYMGHYEELENLVHCIRTGEETAMGVRQAAYVTAVEKALLRSIETRSVIDFEDYLKKNNASFLLEGRR